MTSSTEHIPLFEMTYEGDEAEVGDLESCKAFIQDINSFNVFHVNICSIKKNFDQLLILLKSLNYKLDCLVLTEARLTSPCLNLNMFQIEGYKMYSSGSHYRQNDGVVLYVRDTLPCTCKEMIITDSNCLTFSVTKSKKEFICAAFYRSPNGRFENFISSLPRILENIKKPNAINLILGDLNINILNNQDMKVNEYLNLLSEKGFTSYCDKPTRGDNCLDHLFVHPNIGNEGKAFVLQTNISDHDAVLFKFNFGSENEPRDRVKSYLKKDINYETLLTELNEEIWEDVLQSLDVEQSIDCLTNKIKYYVEKNSVTQLIKIVRAKSPWITEGLVNCLNKRDQLHLKCRRQPFNPTLKSQYKKYRNKLNSIIARAKTNYFASKISQANGDKKKIYNTINDAIKYKPRKTGDPDKIKLGNAIIDTYEEPKKVANEFNSHYIQVGSFGSTGTAHQQYIPNDADAKANTCSMYLNLTCEREISTILDSMRGDSAAGHDDIQIKLLKKIKAFIVKPLVHIFNTCFKQGVFPQQFKLAIIRPIFKKGDAQCISNYRPISLTTAFSKLFERIIKARFCKFLDENNILSPSQYGFRQGRNTNDAVVRVSEFGYEAMDEGNMAAIVLMDQSKAFDRVDHRILIDILGNIGLRGKVLDLFKSYLSDRSQQVKIRDSLSEKMTTGHFSTPQGTVLSPVLYNVYVHKMYELELGGQLVSYADDTALCVKGKTWADVIQCIQNDMKTINYWFEVHNLSLNLDKTKIMPLCITKNKLPPQRQIVFHTDTCNPGSCTCGSIDIVTHWTYLGVELDAHLRWDIHINKLTKRLRKLIGSFLVLRTFLKINLLREIYFALCQSTLEYAICAYGRASFTALSKLKTVQNSLLKIILNKVRLYPTVQLYKNAKVLNVAGLFSKNICLFVYKYKLVTFTDHQYNLRRKNVHIPRMNTNRGQKSISFMGVKLFQSLPIDIKEETNPIIFKIKLKIWLMNNSLELGIIA